MKCKFPYDHKLEAEMRKFYERLNEKDRRHYASLEASKLDHGGIDYIAKLFNCSRQTIYAGIDELKKTAMKQSGSGG